MFFGKRREKITQGYDYHDVLVVPVDSYSCYKSRSDVTFNPSVFVANMDGIGDRKMLELAPDWVKVALTKDHKPHITDTHRSIVTIGEDTESIKQYLDILYVHKELSAEYGLILNIDVANAYRVSFLNWLSRHLFKGYFSHYLPHYRKSLGLKIMVGNVCTYEGAYALFKLGVDIVKVGIGPGSVCLTREVTGIGCPQVTAVMECARAAADYSKKYKRRVEICADGGIQTPGDVVKAYVAGADHVMVGGLFAKAVGGSFKGSSVLNEGYDYKTSEGKYVELEVPASETDKKAKVEQLCSNILAGVKSAATYLGAGSIQDFRRKGRFVTVTRQLNNLFTV